MQRRQVLLGTTAALAGIAGCVGGETGPRTTSETHTSTKTPTTTEAPTTETPEPTIAPSEVSDEEAEERALTAEEAHLREHLENASCLSDWGTTPTTVSKQATVNKRTATGVYVEVTHPYWYSTESTEADLGSDAVYVVTADGVRRDSGDDVEDSISC